jgi:hypothetical protein
MPGNLSTKSGRILSQVDLDRLAERAEGGIDLSNWSPRRGRPSLDSAVGKHSPRVAVRVPEVLRSRATARAASEGRSMSEVLRRLLEDYVARGASPSRASDASRIGGGEKAQRRVATAKRQR